MNVKLHLYQDSTVFGIIEEVQKYQFLYDIQPCDRGDKGLKSMRSEVWGEIAALLGLPALECQAIWKRLRGTFAKYFKAYQSSKTTDKPYNPNNWKYFDSLLFLIPYIEYLGSRDIKGVPRFHNFNKSKTISKFAQKAIKRSKTILTTKESSQRNNSSDVERKRRSESIDYNMLINQVKAHEVIYANNEKLLRKMWVDTEEKRQAWKKIAEAMGLAEVQVVNSWRRIWTAFRSEDKSWKWHTAMQFFRPYNISKLTRAYDNSDMEVEMEVIDHHTSVESSVCGAQYQQLPRDHRLSSDESMARSAAATYNPGQVNGQPNKSPASRSSHNSKSQNNPGTHIVDVDADDSVSCVVPGSSASASVRRIGHSTNPPTSIPKYSEYHFGMCVAQMMEEVPSTAKTKLKAKILGIVASAVN